LHCNCEDDLGGTFSNGKLYALEPSVCSPGDIVILRSFASSSAHCTMTGLMVLLSIPRNEPFLLREPLRYRGACFFRELLLITEPCMLKDDFLCILCSLLHMSTKLGSVSSRISESGRVAVDHGGMLDVDQGGGARLVISFNSIVGA